MPWRESTETWHNTASMLFLVITLYSQLRGVVLVGRDQTVSGLDCLICGLDCLICGLDSLICGLDCLMCAEFARQRWPRDHALLAAERRGPRRTRPNGSYLARS